MQGGSLFSIPYPVFVICALINDGHSDWWCEVAPHSSSDLHFSNHQWCGAFFSCAYWPPVYLPWRNVYSGLLSIFPLGCWFFLLLGCISCLYILESLRFWKLIVWKQEKNKKEKKTAWSKSCYIDKFCSMSTNKNRCWKPRSPTSFYIHTLRSQNRINSAQRFKKAGKFVSCYRMICIGIVRLLLK